MPNNNLNIIQDIIPAGRRNRPGRANPMLFVTIHETGNRNNGANAIRHGAFLRGNDAANQPVSWHYTTDDTQTVQHLPENEDAFHAGDGAGPGNRQSIGIEMAVNADGNFTRTVERTIALVADICIRRDIPIANIRQHFNWSGKNCPQNIRAGRPITWAEFIRRVENTIKAGIATEPNAPNHNKTANAKLEVVFDALNANEINPEDTAIMGKSVLTPEMLAAFLLSRNSNPRINTSALALARYFIEEGETVGVRGDIAFMMSIHETGWFRYGGQVLPEQNNFAGIGATNNSPTGAGAWFDTPQLGVRAQMHHLFTYATSKLAEGNISPRAHIVQSLNSTRGPAIYWVDLNGRWAVPGTTYAQMIFQLFRQAIRFVEGQPALWPPCDIPESQLIGDYGCPIPPEYRGADTDGTELQPEAPAGESVACNCPSWEWAIKNDIVGEGPVWEPSRRVTLAQVIEVLYRAAKLN